MKRDFYNMADYWKDTLVEELKRVAWYRSPEAMDYFRHIAGYYNLVLGLTIELTR